MQDGKPEFAYAYSNQPQHKYRVVADQPLVPGNHIVRVKFNYDGGGIGKAATAVLLVDEKEAAQGRVDRQTNGFIEALNGSSKRPSARPADTPASPLSAPSSFSSPVSLTSRRSTRTPPDPLRIQKSPKIYSSFPRQREPRADTHRVAPGPLFPRGRRQVLISLESFSVSL
jgi:hypothetical protein